jgi:D-glucosaminate-6-phosphate ammonia-lyase
LEHSQRQIINAAGNVLVPGGFLANKDSIQAAAEILNRFVEMPELNRYASQIIAQTCESEAGCVTSCTAAGISLSVAAAMTGNDLARANLPDTTGLKNQVIIQGGHNCHFGGGVDQMDRLSGAQIVEIGLVNRAEPYQLAAAINGNTAAALFVVSHQTTQTGMIELLEFADIYHANNIPVIVDAASECDLKELLTQGADLVLYSAHKFLTELATGIVAGRKDLVRACYLQQIGVGRPMKVGREIIASAIATLDLWSRLDHAKLNIQVFERTQAAFDHLRKIANLTTSIETDPAGNPVPRARLKIDPAVFGVDAEQFRRMLAHGSPVIYLWNHDHDANSLLIDPSTVSDAEMRAVTTRISAVLPDTPDSTSLADVPLPPSENLDYWPDPPPDSAFYNQ